MAEVLSSQTGAKQTMSAWTKVVESSETLPVQYRNFLEAQIKKDQKFPYTLLAPSLVKPRGRTTEKLIVDTGDSIHILERKNNLVDSKSYAYQDICTMELGSILLGSWLTVDGISSSGTADIATIDFNTSSMRHYEVLMKKMRPANSGDQPANTEKDKFDFLSEINFKLMNYGRSSLVSGESVRQIIFQPEIKKPFWTLLGDLFQKLVTPPHLTVLTDLELILIEDIGRGRQAHEARYGGIWQYIPLHSIRSAKWLEADEERLTLTITVRTGRVIEKIFAGSNKPELVRLCAQIQEMTG